jgi:hypothetical protein
MADDTQVNAQVINEQIRLLQIGFDDVTFHVNSTTGTMPSHYVEQGTYSSLIGDFTGSYTFTENGNHITGIYNTHATVAGDTYDLHTTYASNATGSYNVTNEEFVNGVSQGVVHYQG